MPQDVASLEGACNWHVDCRNVRRAVARELNVDFSTIGHLQIWQYIQPASQLPDSHTDPGPPHAPCSPPGSSEMSHPDSFCKKSVCITKEFLYTLSETVSGKLCMLVVLIGASTCTGVRRHCKLEWANPHIYWRLARWRGVFFTDESWFLLFSSDGRLRVWRRMGEQFAEVNIVFISLALNTAKRCGHYKNTIPWTLSTSSHKKT